jgi:hypothetical protein
MCTNAGKQIRLGIRECFEIHSAKPGRTGNLSRSRTTSAVGRLGHRRPQVFEVYRELTSAGFWALDAVYE